MAYVRNINNLRLLTSTIIIDQLKTLGVTLTGASTINKITTISCSTGSRIYYIRFEISGRGSMVYDVKEFPPSSSTNNKSMINRIKRIMKAFHGTMSNSI